MLKFNHLSLRRGPRELLHDVNCTIHTGQRVGITGANGVGKSSLFSMILGDLHPDGGDFTLPSTSVIAHVAQETPAVEQSALDYAIDGDRQLRALEQKIAKAEKNNDGETLAHLYSELESMHGYSAASRAGKLLHGLGFSNEEEHKAVNEFSGGWRMRLNLAQALMCPSDLLLLDEPTNHLDMEAVIWLEEWLQAYKGTLLLISHDRDFLDRVANHIAHIEHAGLKSYTGNYSDFELRRAEQLAQQQSAYEKQQRDIAHMQSFVDRFKAKATKAKQAQSRVKALEKMTLISAAHIDSPFHFQFFQPDRVPSTLLHLENASAGYSGNPILKNINLNILAGSRIGLLGFNGAGKSTFIKLLAGELSVINGERTEAKDIKIGYFAQHQLDQLDAHASPLLHLQRINAKATEGSLRSYLGGFGFRDDMALSPTENFSGGEKARLVLAMIVYQKPNFLLLDEPTNHLDLEMRHALSLAIQEFTGALIVVSHDRHLLRTVTDNFLLVADGKVEPFEGDLDDYRDWMKEKIKYDNNPDNNLQEVNSGNKKQQRQQSAEIRKQIQPLTNLIKKLEKQIDKLNSEKSNLQNQLADNAIYEDASKHKLKQLISEQSDIDKKLEDIEQEWLDAVEKLEELKG